MWLLSGLRGVWSRCGESVGLLCVVAVYARSTWFCWECRCLQGLRLDLFGSRPLSVCCRYWSRPGVGVCFLSAAGECAPVRSLRCGCDTLCLSVAPSLALTMWGAGCSFRGVVFQLRLYSSSLSAGELGRLLSRVARESRRFVPCMGRLRFILA